MDIKISSSMPSFGMKIAELRDEKQYESQKQSIGEVTLKNYTAFIGGDVFTPSCDVKKQDLLFKDNKLVAIDDFDENSIPSDQIKWVDVSGKYLAPSIIEQHIHGGLDVNFNTANEDEIRGFLKEIPKYGVAAILPTVMTDDEENIKQQIATIKKIKNSPDEGSAKIIGVHLEGPFISPAKKGAHAIEFMKAPTVENYKIFDDDIVKMVTYAPEEDKDGSFSKFLESKGIVKSAGHTASTGEDLAEKGITQVTHLFNAMPGLHHRNNSVTLTSLTDDSIYTEVIGDMKHVSPEMLKLTLAVKPENKLILISDATPIAHGKKGVGYFAESEITEKDGIAVKTSDSTIAGSVLFVCDMFKKLKNAFNTTFQNLVMYSSINPAKQLGIEDEYKIGIGNTPNFTVWNKNSTEPIKTFIA